MITRYVLRLREIDKTLIAHDPDADLVANITIETSLPKDDVVKRLMDLATVMDAVRTP